MSDELLDQAAIVKSIQESSNMDEMQKLIDLFNVAQTKKTLLRVNKLNDILEKIDVQIADRFDKRAGEFNNQDLLKYFETIQTSIEKAQKSTQNTELTPMIQLNAENVNIGPSISLSRESRDNILDFIKSVMESEDSPVTTDEIKEITEYEFKQDE